MGDISLHTTAGASPVGVLMLLQYERGACAQSVSIRPGLSVIAPPATRDLGGKAGDAGLPAAELGPQLWALPDETGLWKLNCRTEK